MSTNSESLPTPTISLSKTTSAWYDVIDKNRDESIGYLLCDQDGWFFASADIDMGYVADELRQIADLLEQVINENKDRAREAISKITRND
jgi:hypothetical protein